MGRAALALALALAVVGLVGCDHRFIEVGDCAASLGAGDLARCAVPGWKHRDYDVVMPDTVDGPLPVVLGPVTQ